MEERNSVSVKVFGQEYSISGDMPRDEIMRVADLVDQKMKEIAAAYNGSTSSIAVLAAMNLALGASSAEEKDRQLKDLEDKLSRAENFNDVLRTRIEELTTQLENSKNVPVESQKLIHELEAKCRDIESSFFDIQMENIHLKNELENMKKQLR